MKNPAASSGVSKSQRLEKSKRSKLRGIDPK
jgi:hypothetical protein